MVPAFAALLELQQMRRTAHDLLSTYVGPNSGERIIKGEIRRGEGQIMHAVIWYCDLRGFTTISETEPLNDVIALLNGYFDRVAGPVVEHGGEILKFIGDAMLAIFPCETEGQNACAAVEAALAAAEGAVKGVAGLNAERGTSGLAQFQCGVAVNIGETIYGNIGAADRLDFTVIGPAVNLVSRIEPLCAALGYPIVVSEALAKLSPRKFVSLGRHELKGIAEPREVFALADVAD